MFGLNALRLLHARVKGKLEGLDLHERGAVAYPECAHAAPTTTVCATSRHDDADDSTDEMLASRAV
jgi:hypothetical protein